MIYIITEDSNSARNFWEHAVSVFAKSGSYVFVDSNIWGNTSLDKRTRDVVREANEGDIIAVLFDCIENTRDFKPKRFIRNMLRLCKSKGIAFRYNTYYCFEEMFLSYNELLKISNSRSISVLQKVYDALHAGINYYKTNYKSVVDDYKLITGRSSKNREQFANALLVDVTRKITGHFSIHKSGKPFDDRAECWVKSCWMIQSSQLNQKNNMCYICNACKYSCKSKTKREKIIDLNNNAII